MEQDNIIYDNITDYDRETKEVFLIGVVTAACFYPR